MAKKQQPKSPKKTKKTPNNTQPQLNLTPEMKERLDKLKTKLDKFTKSILEKFDVYITGISLLPPPQPPKTPEEKKNFKPDQVNVLVLIDDSDSKKMSKDELADRLTKIIDSIAKDIDPNLVPQTMILTELRDACFDSKYDLIKQIAMSTPLYDPKDMLAALKISELHKAMVIQKFEKYITSYVAAGSLFRGEKSNDIDVYVIIDDTDVKRMSRAELKDKLRSIIVGMGFEASKITGVKKQFHIQTYILTDFWDNLKDANPVIYTLLRDGVPIYDRGVFMPWKLLLKMGRIKPSPEAIDMNMDLGERLIQRIKFKMLSVVGEDLFYALLNPAQAALMLYGIPPPTPKETSKLLDQIFVKKEKLLEKKYVTILENIRKAFKDVEHGKLKEISGKEIDKMLGEAKDYLKRIKELFKQIEERTEKESIIEVYETCVAVTKDMLAEVGEKSVLDEQIEEKFKEKLISDEKVPAKFLRILENVKKAKKDFLTNKLSKQEVNKTKKEARIFIKGMVEHLQRKKVFEMERAKLRFKYGENKFGEILVLGDDAFLIKDLEKRDELFQAKVGKDGSLQNLKKSKPEELEKHLKEKRNPRRLFVNSQLLSELENFIGEPVELMVNY